ncbi:hypothetical protein FGU71_03610 [Erythrobacter insulae]|uniref:Uncharacterized protein n=1 Tax=Erythrobacter insulae TaxID=2584124 RepID=A0A547PA64_9SPHN|nr:hypothetical protein [Erythrobacter insulae]TRD11026.1 hypothetical protein FGU71_03610 [Erythrobacter insulae]
MLQPGGALGVQRFVHDANALVAEYNSAHAMLRRYIHGLDMKADDPLDERLYKFHFTASLSLVFSQIRLTFSISSRTFRNPIFQSHFLLAVM